MRISLAILALSITQGCVTTTPSRNPASPEQAAIRNLDLGVGYMRQGRPDLALSSLQEALEYDPRLASAHSTIALVYEQLDDAEAAEEHYRRATQLEPDDGSAANSYAVFLCRSDRWQEAERFFRRAADSNSYATPAVALTNAGVCARTARELEDAEQYFREALERDANAADALYHLADLSLQAEDYLSARAFTQRYLASTASNPEVLLICVQTERRLGADAAAQRCAEQLRSGFPNSAEVARLDALESDEPR
jgi:type IV pilus assembly protein PilF